MNVRELETILSKRGHPRVLIVGDLILDAYVTGEVARISPEAPIPVLTAKRREERLGGAGNVGANLIAMQAEVDVVGVLGDDENGRSLREMMTRLHIDTGGCAIDASRPSIL
jgi:D-beta-D-heptose 7-phosphate kinase/D-beta-D-heptose 1-phosphate adenosyltransferase